MSSLFTPYKLGPVTLRNRTIRSAAFESMGKDFGPTEQLKDYHVAVARGGVGMTTLAYAAVCRSGLSFNKQLWLRPEIVPGLRGITDAVARTVTQKLFIPPWPADRRGSESLNVAMATGIVCGEFRRQASAKTGK